MNKVCPTCNAEFETPYSYQKYCSETCRNNRARNSGKVTRSCINPSCGKAFTVPGPKNPKKYCSSSCAATVNNQLVPKRKLEGQCSVCHGPASGRTSYCKKHKGYSPGVVAYKRQMRIKAWLNGEWSGGSEVHLSKIIRAYLLEEAGYTCSYPGCGFNTRHPVDNSCVLEINHVDGDGSNHDPSNLEVLCPNHHALTANYRARNMGKGRSVYYLRVRRSKAVV